MHQNSISFSKQQQEISLITTLPFSSQCSTLMWGLGGIRQVCGQRNVMGGMLGDTSIPHTPPAPHSLMAGSGYYVLLLRSRGGNADGIWNDVEKPSWRLEWWVHTHMGTTQPIFPSFMKMQCVGSLQNAIWLIFSNDINITLIISSIFYIASNMIWSKYLSGFASCYPWHDHIASDLPPRHPFQHLYDLSLIKLSNWGTADVHIISSTSAFYVYFVRKPCFEERKHILKWLFNPFSPLSREYRRLHNVQNMVQTLYTLYCENHFHKFYLSQEVSATCMLKYFEIIFHYSSRAEMEYKWVSKQF